MWPLLVGVAFAYELGATTTVDLPGIANGLAAADTDGDGVAELLVATTAGTLLFSGEAVSRFDGVDSGATFAVLEVGGPWVPIRCGEAGVDALYASGAELLFDVDCGALIAADIDDDGVDEVLSARDELTILSQFSAPITLPVSMSGAPLLVTDGAEVWVGSVGQTLLAQVSVPESALLSVLSEPLSGLSAADGGVLLAFGDSATVELPDGSVRILGGQPGRVASADLTGDGITDHAIVHAEGLTLYDGATFATFARLSAELSTPTDPVIADLDGDGCLDIAIADDNQLFTAVGVDCPVVEPIDDADGDGWTVDEGDCDDADASVHPEATELCDGRDQDCDGQVDDPDLEVSVPWPDTNEGGSLSATFIGSGCVASVTVFAGDADHFLSCESTEEDAKTQVQCTALDDGEGDVTAVGMSAEGAPLVDVTIGWSAWNVDPVIIEIPSDIYLYDTADAVAYTLLARDLGENDVLIWELIDPPDEAEVSGDQLIITPGERALNQTLRLRVTDGDGGEAIADLGLTIEPENEGGRGGACCIAATAGIFAPIFLLVARRRGLP